MSADGFTGGSVEERLRALEDVEAIRALMAKYHNACDGWDELGTHKDPAAIAALFTEDGVWDVTARQPPPTGRPDVAALAKALQSIHRIVHFIVNPIITVEGDTAICECKGVLRVQLKDSSRPGWALGLYRVISQRTPDGWRFQSMTWEPIMNQHRYDPSS
jgi:ketosteroid isomerase-like protein